MCTGAPLRSVQCVHRGAVTLKAAPWLRLPNWRRASRFRSSTRGFRAPSFSFLQDFEIWTKETRFLLLEISFWRIWILRRSLVDDSRMVLFPSSCFCDEKLARDLLKISNRIFFRCKCLWIENHWSNAAMEKVNKILRLVYIRRSSV